MQQAAQSAKELIRDKVFMGRAHYDAVEYPFNLPENQHSSYHDGDGAAHDVPAKLLDMIKEVHLTIRITGIPVAEFIEETQKAKLGRKVMA